jgi:FtsH-binding integral membrane protein
MPFNKSKLQKNRNIKQKTDLSHLFKLLYEKQVFFSLILVTLVIQLYITYYISENFDIEKNKNMITNNHPFNIDTNYIIAIVALIVLLFILALVTMPPWLKFIVFSLFSSVFGVILAYRKSHYDPNTIKTAFIGTIGIFVSMFAFGVGLIISNIQLSAVFGLRLLYALMFLIMMIIVQTFIIQSSLLYKIIVVSLLMLFSVYIVYDTNQILQRDYSGDFITASLDYYLEIINIFSNLLRLSEFDD